MKAGKTVEEIAVLETTFKRGVKAYVGKAGVFYTLIVETFAAMRDGDENDEADTVKEVKAQLIQWAVDAGMAVDNARYNINAALRKAGIAQRAPRSDKGTFPNEAKELAAYAIEKYGADKAAAFCNSAGRYIKSMAKLA